MTIQYTPHGVCSRGMTVSVENDRITAVEVEGGCSGNLQGVCRLLYGMPVTEAISRLRGIRCGNKASSCPDQLAQAMEKLMENQ